MCARSQTRAKPAQTHWQNLSRNHLDKLAQDLSVANRNLLPVKIPTPAIAGQARANPAG